MRGTSTPSQPHSSGFRASKRQRRPKVTLTRIPETRPPTQVSPSTSSAQTLPNIDPDALRFILISCTNATTSCIPSQKSGPGDFIINIPSFLAFLTLVLSEENKNDSESLRRAFRQALWNGRRRVRFGPAAPRTMPPPGFERSLMEVIKGVVGMVEEVFTGRVGGLADTGDEKLVIGQKPTATCSKKEAEGKDARKKGKRKISKGRGGGVKNRKKRPHLVHRGGCSYGEGYFDTPYLTRTDGGPAQGHYYHNELKIAHTPGNGQSTSVVPSRQSNNNNSAQRRDDNHDDDEGKDGAPLHGGPSPPQDPSDKAKKRLACPFFKRSPQRIKEHLYRHHLLPPHCRRCHTLFPSDDDDTPGTDRLHAHQRANTPCELRTASPPEGVTHINWTWNCRDPRDHCPYFSTSDD
ncbi:hypothetical protein MKZ38_005475 [Zalerion maritima]|uniref:C2H2-type domain-containing protein n=1 Tax=Zalerion maritima TaxID=339359 RepID=A0AAD5RL10_9PEZI|nr:hypothetical protein MKZ38_005475 [Zalerion maritima]